METKSTPLLYLLDFDGTLGDTRRIILKTMSQTISELHLEPRTDEQCAQMIGLPLKQTFTDLIAMTSEMGDRCVEVYRRLFDLNDTPGMVTLFPGVAETLRELHRRGHCLTIVSSRGKESLDRFVVNLGLSDLISLVVSADDVTEAKPHPQPVLLTLERMGFAAENAIVVGDTCYDIEMGRRAGVRTIGVTYGNGSRQELLNAQADGVIDHFSDLLV